MRDVVKVSLRLENGGVFFFARPGDWDVARFDLQIVAVAT